MALNAELRLNNLEKELDEIRYDLGILKEDIRDLMSQLSDAGLWRKLRVMK